MKHTRIYLLFLLIVLVVLGCGGDNGGVNEPTSSAPSYAGTWTGAIVSFDVSADHAITRYRSTLEFAFCKGTFELMPNAKITNDAFSFTLDQNGVRTQVSGMFTSSTEVSGSFGTITYSVVCGNSFVVGSSGGYGWSATKL